MTVSRRVILVAIAVFGVGLGVAFGAGVAYGRGDPKTAEGGLTAQQLQSMLGINVAQTSGANPAPTGGTGAGAQRQGTTQAASRMTTGSITAIEGQTLTIETRQGSQKVHLSASTILSRLMPGSVTDLKTGMTVLANGNRRDDGSLDATDLSEVGSGVQALLGGGAAPASATPSGR